MNRTWGALALLLPALAFAEDAPEKAVATAPPSEPEDPRLWLEEVEGEAALDWARARNAESRAALASDPGFEALRTRLLEAYDSKDKIPYVTRRGEWLYNLWQDAEHPRGLWRRTTLDSYRTDAPDWEVVLDIDALGAEEGKSWVWDGATCLRPEQVRCLISLSPGGSDAAVVREFDTAKKAFVAGGFELPEAKQGVDWIDLDHVYVGTPHGGGAVTDSGYPRTARLWTRGTPVADAELVFEGQQTDISVGASHDPTPGFERDFVHRAITFYSNELFERTPEGLKKIHKQDSANAAVWRDRLLIELREDWQPAGRTYKAGSLLAADYGRWMAGERALELLFEPTETRSLRSFTTTRNHLLLSVLDTVRSRIEVLTPPPPPGKAGKKAKKGRGKGASAVEESTGWTRAPLPGAPEFGSLGIRPVDEDLSDDYWLTVTDYLTPSTLRLGTVGMGPAKRLKALPAFFDAAGLVVTQHFASSADGTKVPYFQIAPKDLPLDGSAPTVLYGYGGFEVSMLPYYSATTGIAWLERGGVYVVANIRGGGEFGPRWHQAALKENRHRAYEDFAAVAEDLVARKVTSHERLGALGGSNGGLLTGNMYTLYPRHFGALVSSAPLLDMRRYSKLLAGASWMGEYGDPDDPAQWAFIKTFSPYHGVDPDQAYPPLLITTSTKDDRVHPAHARKMAALLGELGKDVLYYENIEGGHGGAADNAQAALLYALRFSFLAERLGLGEAAPTED